VEEERSETKDVDVMSEPTNSLKDKSTIIENDHIETKDPSVISESTNNLKDATTIVEDDHTDTNNFEGMGKIVFGNGQRPSFSETGTMISHNKSLDTIAHLFPFKISPENE
jgi:hypothetical protein